ncbi:sensor histidine kinase [Georgenia sp. Z1344]|uniref:sensor histidine kinase n=1 Tax=Georgenia sp. Z1344 TaxID=3416706 RepID=UPI003CEC9AF1
MTATPAPGRRAARTMQVGLDLLALMLAALVVWRGEGAAPLGIAFALVHVVGRLALGPVVTVGGHAQATENHRAAGTDRPPRTPRPWAQLAWVGVLTALAIAAGVLSVEGIWLAFPVFLLQLHVLPAAAGIVAVALTTVVTVTIGVLRHGSGVGGVLGPVLGAAVCVGVVLGVRAVLAEAEQRRELLEDLVAARQVLAERERAAAVTAERQRLAREIHDSLAQGLASIELVLRAADGALAAGDTNRATDLVDTARTAARDNLAEARAFVRDLPSPLVDTGLHDAVTRLGEQTSRGSGVRVDVTVTGDERPLPGVVEQALWRVAQQALANAVEHAEATRAHVTLTYLGDSVALDVVDDGSGFDPTRVLRAADPPRAFDAGELGRVPDADTKADSVDHNHDHDHDHEDADGRGTGLAGMADRLRAVGGSLTVESAPGSGTAIGAAVPL